MSLELDCSRLLKLPYRWKLLASSTVAKNERERRVQMMRGVSVRSGRLLP